MKIGGALINSESEILALMHLFKVYHLSTMVKNDIEHVLIENINFAHSTQCWNIIKIH